jgi:hypothetical protein
MLDIHAGLRLDPAGGLQPAACRVLVAGGGGVADVDLTASDIQMPAWRQQKGWKQGG